MYKKWVFRVKIIIFALFSESVESLYIQTSLFIWQVLLSTLTCCMSLITGSVPLMQPDVSVLIKDTQWGHHIHQTSALGFKPNSRILNIKPQHSTFCCINSHKHDSVSSSFGVFSSLFKGFNQLTRLKIVSTMSRLETSPASRSPASTANFMRIPLMGIPTALSPALAMTESGERGTGETPVWPYRRIKSMGKYTEYIALVKLPAVKNWSWSPFTASVSFSFTRSRREVSVDVTTPD